MLNKNNLSTSNAFRQMILAISVAVVKDIKHVLNQFIIQFFFLLLLFYIFAGVLNFCFKTTKKNTQPSSHDIFSIYLIDKCCFSFWILFYISMFKYAFGNTNSTKCCSWCSKFLCIRIRKIQFFLFLYEHDLIIFH